MYRSFKAAVILGLWIMVWAGAVQAATDVKLERVLEKLNHLNNSLQTFQADIIQTKWINLLQEFDTPEKGKLYFKKTSEGVYLRKEIEEPGHTIMLVTPEEIIVYYPKKNQAVKRSLAEHKAKYSSTGIGTSSKELKENFDISFVRDEIIKKKVYNIIELVPKTEKIKNYFQKLRLWVDDETGVPVRQRIEELNGDYTIIQFLKIKINKKIKDKVFELKLPKDVELIS